jgi:hypothetical protein
MKGLAQPQTKKDVLAPPEANKRIEPTCNPENDREIIFGRGCLQHNRRHRDDGQDCKECGSSTRTLGDRSEDNSYDAQERNEAGKRKAPSQFKEREVDGVKGPREENLSL